MFYYFFDFKKDEDANAESNAEQQMETPFTQAISNMDRLRQKYPGASIFDRLLLEANKIEKNGDSNV